MTSALPRPISKLVIVCGDYPPVQSGEAGHALHLARAIAARGIEVHVLTSAISDVPSEQAFTVHPIITRWTWRAAPRIAAFLRRISPDAVLLLYLDGMYYSHPLITFAPTLVRWILPRARFVTQFENTGREPSVPSLGRRIARKLVATALGRATVHYNLGTLLRDSHHVIALSEPQRMVLAEEFPQASPRISLIPPPPLLRLVPEANGRSRFHGRTMLSVTDENFVVLYYGYMYPGKGLETLLPAMRHVMSTNPQVRLVLAGEVLGHALAKGDTLGSARYMRELQGIVSQLGLGDRVTWTGALSPDSDEGSLLMWAADLCVLPFDQGVQLNNSTFAAAASHGLPTLTTKGGRTEPAFVHGHNVWLCEPLDATAMSVGVQTLVDNAAQRAAIGEGARQLAAELFSWDHAIERTLRAMMTSSTIDR